MVLDVLESLVTVPNETSPAKIKSLVTVPNETSPAKINSPSGSPNFLLVHLFTLYIISGMLLMACPSPFPCNDRSTGPAHLHCRQYRF